MTYGKPLDAHDIDAATGLPRLPPNHFWRVRRTESTYIDVLWMKNVTRKSWLGRTHTDSIRISFSVFSENDEPDNPALALLQCTQAMITTHNQRLAQKQAMPTLFGDYPPNTTTAAASARKASKS